MVSNNILMSDASEQVGLYRRSMLTMLSNVVEPCPSTRHGRQDGISCGVLHGKEPPRGIVRFGEVPGER